MACTERGVAYAADWWVRERVLRHPWWELCILGGNCAPFIALVAMSGSPAPSLTPHRRAPSVSPALQSGVCGPNSIRIPPKGLDFGLDARADVGSDIARLCRSGRNLGRRHCIDLSSTPQPVPGGHFTGCIQMSHQWGDRTISSPQMAGARVRSLPKTNILMGFYLVARWAPNGGDFDVRERKIRRRNPQP